MRTILTLITMMILTISCNKTTVKPLSNNQLSSSKVKINTNNLCRLWSLYATQTNNQGIINVSEKLYITYYSNHTDILEYQSTYYNYTWRVLNDSTIHDVDTLINNPNSYKYVIELTDSTFIWYNISGSTKYYKYMKSI